MKSLETYGLCIPKILLPKDNIPLSSWAVIACDQYTQDRDYWQKAAKAVGTEPSALNLILPEVYLNDSDKNQRIQNIHQAMKEYQEKDIFKEPVEGFIYMERTTQYGRVRKGLIVAVDLETYEWQPETKALIRATEATIPERIPPRMEIRRGAPLELPHIMLLVNDPEKSLVEGLGQAVKNANVPAVYDGDLMLDSGHVTGYPIQGALLEQATLALEKLALANTTKDGSVFLFAVGDGNHSLATAKAVWDEYKNAQLQKGCTLEEINDSLLRYALVEIVNIYDEGLTFEPIHRVLFNVDGNKLMDFCCKKLEGKTKVCNSEQELEQLVANSNASFGFVQCNNDDSVSYICLETPIKELAISRLQPVLDEFMKDATLANPTAEIDYIHGSEEVFRLGTGKNAVAILLPPVEKGSFFATIAGNGPLPRKSFSMGEASEKRFYLEVRSL